MMGTIVSLHELTSLRKRFRSEGKKVVFSNGVFDILHRGHIEDLNKAKALGDVLTVGVNSDASVRRIKGNDRPVVPQEDRAFLVANIAAVDYVCIFEEETPLAAITALKPDILVKGADWEVERVVGRDVVEESGGKVVTIELTPGRSTSAMIQRIRAGIRQDKR